MLPDCHQPDVDSDYQPSGFNEQPSLAYRNSQFAPSSSQYDNSFGYPPCQLYETVPPASSLSSQKLTDSQLMPPPAKPNGLKQPDLSHLHPNLLRYSKNYRPANEASSKSWNLPSPSMLDPVVPKKRDADTASRYLVLWSFEIVS
jgi:hypothetical protein